MASKYNLKEIFEKKYDMCKSSLKQTSLDDRNIGVNNYLCTDESLEVFDFDSIKDMEAPTCKSPDAIYLKDKIVYVIEFKNQNPSGIRCQPLKEKFKYGVKFFKSIITNVQDYQFIACLVYKNQSSTKDSQRYKQRIQKNACCDIHDANKNLYNNFFSNIITQDVNFYQIEFKELAC